MKWLIAMVWSVNALAHEMVPARADLKLSHVSGVLKAELALFNKRADVDYYYISVFDDEWSPVTFVTTNRLIQVGYLGRTKFDIYLRSDDAQSARYVCSTSRLNANGKGTLVSSRICSRLMMVGI